MVSKIISDKVRLMRRSAIHEMTRLSKELDDVVSLSWAKPLANTPHHIRDYAAKKVIEGMTDGYSSSYGLDELRDAIVKKLLKINNIETKSSGIIVTVGAIEGIATSLLTILNPGDEVILPSPTYSTHVSQVLLASGKPVFAPLIEEKGFAIDFDSIEKAISKRTKAIIFCSPNNPTGTVFSEEELRRLSEIALRHDLMVITDEAYEYFTFDEHKHFSMASIQKMRKNVISCFTLTKTYAMTGWRIGYLCADEEIVTQISKSHIPFTICAPVASQYAALAAMTGPQDCIDEFRSKYKSARDLMCSRLDNLKHVFEYQRPYGSYLMFPKILLREGSNSEKFCKKLLYDAKVSSTPGGDFGPTGEGHLRLSFCVPEDMINIAFDRMDGYFK